MFTPIQPTHWRKMPFVRILTPYLLGVLLQGVFSIKIPSPIFLLIPIVSGLLITAIIKTKKPRIKYLSIFIFSSLCLFGIINSYQSTPGIFNNHYLNHKNKDQNSYAGIITQTKKTTKSTQLTIQLTDYQTPTSNSNYTKGTIIAYLNDTSQNIIIGQKIVFQKSLQSFKPPENPDAFNYSAYLAQQGIFHFIYLDTTNYLLFPSNRSRKFGFSSIRTQLLVLLRKTISDPWQYQIAAAMLLGDRTDMDRELRDQFADTGLMHILAVSGLHIGIVYTLLFFLFGKFKSSLLGIRIIQTALILGGIWTFVLIAGAPASAVRAGFLFSVIQIGRLIRRDASIYNSLAAAAFCLLVWQPSWIKDIGFQLSFAAVWGIVYFQPKIFQLLLPPGRIGHYIWSLTSVSIAAQLVTTPISLYYFHQVPVYFWLSGLIGLPLAPIILFSGIAFIASSFLLTPLADLFTWVLESALWVLQKSTSAIANFPGVYLGKEFWINTSDLFLLYLILFLLILYLETRDKRWILITLLGSIIYSLVIPLKAEDPTPIVTFYSIRSAQAVDFFHPQGSYCITDSSYMDQVQYAATNWRIRNGIRSNELTIINKDTSFWHPALLVHQRTIELEGIWIHFGKISHSIHIHDPNKYEILYVIDNHLKPQNIHPNQIPDVVILDRNLRLYQVKKWQNWSIDQEVECLNMYDLEAIWISQTETRFIIQNQGTERIIKWDKKRDFD